MKFIKFLLIENRKTFQFKNSPKFCTLHGNIIVSPITALYKCPRDKNFGNTVALVSGVTKPSVTLLPKPIKRNEKEKKNDY